MVVVVDVDDDDEDTSRIIDGGNQSIEEHEFDCELSRWLSLLSSCVYHVVLL